VDTNEELRKLRMGAAATALNMARANPSYATSLVERMREPDRDEFSDASLVRTLLQH
jgi:hypothetical protein